MIITRSPCGSLSAAAEPTYRRITASTAGLSSPRRLTSTFTLRLHSTFEQTLIVKYSKMERVQSVDQVQHPIVREALRLTGIDVPYLEITSMADIPAGSGLGSSGSFATALLKALHTYQKNLVHPEELAKQACQIEMDILKEPSGNRTSTSPRTVALRVFVFCPTIRWTPGRSR